MVEAVLAAEGLVMQFPGHGSLIDALRYRLRVLLHPDAYGRELEREVEHHLDLESAHQRHAERNLLAPQDVR